MPASARRSVSASDVYCDAVIMVMDQPGQISVAVAVAGPDGLLEGVEDELGRHRGRRHASPGCGGRRRRSTNAT